MQTRIATNNPARMTTTTGSEVCAPTSAVITDSDTMAPIMTTSPWAKLMSPMMP